MADLNEQANKLGIDPSGYGNDDDGQRRLQERIKQVEAERNSFDNEEARGGPIPPTVIGKETIGNQTTTTDGQRGSRTASNGQRQVSDNGGNTQNNDQPNQAKASTKK